ncbi:hypothetical protein [Bacterioplanoides sp.]|uniref:hypothetical protein n=1 Tax=Bacterioplanoides sp. TaxID=2066072 RepID=UPI003B5ADD96
MFVDLLDHICDEQIVEKKKAGEVGSYKLCSFRERDYIDLYEGKIVKNISIELLAAVVEKISCVISSRPGSFGFTVFIAEIECNMCLSLQRVFSGVEKISVSALPLNCLLKSLGCYIGVGEIRIVVLNNELFWLQKQL